MERKGKISAMLLCGCFFAAFCYGGGVAPAYGGEDVDLQKTKIDPRDVHLDKEALSGAEGLPYEYMTPPDKQVKTKIDPRDIYLDREAIHGAEGLPYKNLISPEEYIDVKEDPQDRKLDLEKMLTDDPSFVKGQEDY